MDYMWAGMANFTEPLFRGATVFLTTCNHCGSKDLKRCNSPIETLLGMKFMPSVVCSSCGKELRHLNERHYGVDKKELLNKLHNNPVRKVFGKIPLWAINKS